MRFALKLCTFLSFLTISALSYQGASYWIGTGAIALALAIVRSMYRDTSVEQE